MSNDDVSLWVTQELYWDPAVDSSAIAVSADDGYVTLRGTVGSFREKREAENATKRVYGVRSVQNDLRVRLLTKHRREDADLRGAVLQALMLDSSVPAGVDAKVSGGRVTLTGTVQWYYERDEAEFVAGNVLGVTGVDNEIELEAHKPGAAGTKDGIEKALQRNAKLDADGVAVETYNGTIVLSGTVRSWFEHDAAVDAAWAAPGVTSVDDRILVDY